MPSLQLLQRLQRGHEEPFQSAGRAYLFRIRQAPGATSLIQSDRDEFRWQLLQRLVLLQKQTRECLLESRNLLRGRAEQIRTDDLHEGLHLEDNEQFGNNDRIHQP